MATAMIRNAGQQFICRDERLRVETIDTTWSCAFAKGDEITIAAGMPFGQGGTTNRLRVAEIGGTEPGKALALGAGSTVPAVTA